MARAALALVATTLVVVVAREDRYASYVDVAPHYEDRSPHYRLEEDAHGEVENEVRPRNEERWSRRRSTDLDDGAEPEPGTSERARNEPRRRRRRRERRGRHPALDRTPYPDAEGEAEQPDAAPGDKSAAPPWRRQPRNRAPEPLDSGDEGLPAIERSLASELESNDGPDYWGGSDAAAPPPVRFRPLHSDYPESTERTRLAHSRVSRPDYGDYYDLKKISDIRREPPVLLRRKSTSPRRRVDFDDLPEVAMRRAGVGYNGPPGSAMRHDGVGVGYHDPLGSAMLRAGIDYSRPPGTTMQRAGKNKVTRPSRRFGVVSLPPQYEVPRIPEPIPTTSDVPAPASFVPVASTSLSIAPSPANASTAAPSFAEKSRLSVLKKARMKESARAPVSRKPPVLLHATNRLPTVVMVEAPAEPRMRARDASDDSPEMLRKVKRLMRQKLVAGASNVRDLTDGWDQLVCEYVDVGALADLPDAACRLAPAPHLAAVVAALAIAAR